MRRGDVKKTRPQRSAQPFVTTGRVELAGERMHVQIEMQGGMGPVDADVNSRHRGSFANLTDGQDQRRGRGDVADDQQPRTLAQRRMHGLHDLSVSFDGTR